MTIRMGLHRHTGKRDDMFKTYVDKVRPQFVKFLDGFPQDLADYCHARGTRVIGRVYFQTQKLGAEGSRQMKQVVQTAREKPWVDYWELHNEDWQHGQDMERYAELCIEFMGELDVIGKKAAIGCFSTGQPEVKEWVRFLPALKYAAAHNHAWAAHEYGGGPPGAKWGVGRNQWNNGQPVTDDPCTDPNMRYLGWWCLRYRRAVDEMKRLGMVKIPDLLITEALIDDIQPRPGNVGKGYKDFRGQHPANVGDYADQWAWYCRELSKDPYVIGACDFGWATEDPTWNSFDVSTDPGTFDRLIQTMTALPNTTPAPQPQPEEPMPTPTPSGIINMPAMSHSPRGGTRARYVVVHSTDSPAGSTPDGTARYLAGNDRKVSAHELVAPLAVYVMVPDDRAAHHAGYATLPDGTTGGAVNLASWGLEIYQESGRPCAPELVEIAAGRVAGACKRLSIPAARVVSHAEVDPGRRSDPVGVDMVAFRARVAAMLAEGGQPAPAPGVVQYQKVVWALEQSIRILEGEGLALEANYIKATALADAIKRRDGKA